MARLRLETPVVARWGDRGVLRSYSPATTIGGCVVADPWPAPRPRRPYDLDALLAPPAARVAAAVARAGARGLPVADLPVRLGIPPSAVPALLEGVVAEGVRPIGSRLVRSDVLDQARRRLLEELAAFHRHTPLASGLPLEAARRLLNDADVTEAVVAHLATEGLVVVEGAAVRLSAHEPRLEAGRRDVVDRVGNALRESGFEGRTLPELAAAGPAAELPGVVEYLMREGQVVRVGKDRYYDAGVLDRMIRVTADALADSGEIGVAQLRERLGLTRKFLIPFVEWLDGQGYTVRNGDLRRPGPRLTKGRAAL
jgi:selenocysteine-specific elongation factor